MKQRRRRQTAANTRTLADLSLVRNINSSPLRLEDRTLGRTALWGKEQRSETELPLETRLGWEISKKWLCWNLCRVSRWYIRSTVGWMRGTARMWNECWGRGGFLWWWSLWQWIFVCKKRNIWFLLSIVCPRLLDHTAQLCVTVGSCHGNHWQLLATISNPSCCWNLTDHWEEAAGHPDNEAHVDAAGARENSRWWDKDAASDDATNDYLHNAMMMGTKVMMMITVHPLRRVISALRPTPFSSPPSTSSFSSVSLKWEARIISFCFRGFSDASLFFECILIKPR